MIEAYKLTSLLNQFDIEEVSELTGISENLIEAALSFVKGEKDLTAHQEVEITRLYNSFYRSGTLARKTLKDNTEIAESLKTLIDKGITTELPELRKTIVDEFVYGNLTPELLQTTEAAFFDLSVAQQFFLNDWLNADIDERKEIPRQVATFMQLWADDTNYGDDSMSDMELSEFWKWFRETFYNE